MPLANTQQKNETILTPLTQRQLTEETFKEWISKLSKEEIQDYDQMGFLLKILQDILQEPNEIALPTETPSSRNTSHREVIQIIDEIIFYAQRFYGKEESYKRIGPVSELRGLYKSLKTIEEESTNTIDAEDFFLALRDRTPPILKNLVSTKIDAEDKEKLKNQIKQIFALTEEELEILEDAINRLKSIHIERKKISKRDLKEILDIMAKIDILRRESTKERKKSEIEEPAKILKSLPSWRDFIEDDINSAHNDYQKRRIVDERAKTLASLIENIAPTIMKKYRRTIRKRMQSYPKLKDALKQIDNTKTREQVMLIIEKISKILEYLQFMSNMRQVVDDRLNKKIVYPRRMLKMATVIEKDMEELKNALNWFTQEGTETFPIGGSQSQPGFTIEGISKSTQARKDATINTDNIFDPPTGQQEIIKTQEREIAEQLKNIAMFIDAGLNETKRELGQIKRELAPTVIAEKDPYVTATYKSLSPDVEDFMATVQYTMDRAIIEIINTFGNKNNRTGEGIIPEYKEKIEQTKDLIQATRELRNGILAAESGLKNTKVETKKDPQTTVFQTVNTLKSLSKSLQKFQKYQDEKISKKEFEAIVKGSQYEPIEKLARTVKDFFSNNLHMAITPEVLIAAKTDNDPEKESSNNPEEKALNAFRDITTQLKDLGAFVSQPGSLMDQRLLAEYTYKTAKEISNQLSTIIIYLQLGNTEPLSKSIEECLTSVKSLETPPTTIIQKLETVLIYIADTKEEISQNDNNRQKAIDALNQTKKELEERFKIAA